jgi:hypothetical protein
MGQSDSGKKGTVRNVSGVANAMNITPGGAVVKSILENCAQGRQPLKALGVIKVNDQQADTRMDGDGIRGEPVTS